MLDPSDIRRPLDIRRAVLAELPAADGPLSVGQIATALTCELGADAASPKRVADILRYQERRGRVRV